MPRLCDLQQAFAEAIVEGKYQAVTAAMATDGSARRSVALYRRLIRNNFVQVLKITYPVLHRFVGDGYFGVLARGHLTRYPSTSGDLFLYGRHLPALLQRLDAPALLVELARLEWACHEVYQAADSPPLPEDRPANSPSRCGQRQQRRHPVRRRGRRSGGRWCEAWP